MNKAWVGVDVGKEFHWAHVLDASGADGWGHAAKQLRDEGDGEGTNLEEEEARS